MSNIEVLNQTFSNLISSSELGKKLVLLSMPIVAEHLKMCLEDRKLDFNSIGNPRERLIRQSVSAYYNLISVASDLDKVIYFLSMERTHILANYPQISIKDYYNYHLQNYLIRINSVPDILVFIGNIICKWGLKRRNCNIYGLTGRRNRKKKIDRDILKKIQFISSNIKEIKNKRNSIIHQGYAEIHYFDNSLCWEICPDLGIDLTDDMKEYIENNKVKAINVIKKEIYDILNPTVDILNIYNKKL